MVLKKYMSRESGYEGTNAIVKMNQCKDALKRTRRIGVMDESAINQIRKAAQAYIHHRDIAIRFGEDVSQSPRKLKTNITRI